MSGTFSPTLWSAYVYLLACGFSSEYANGLIEDGLQALNDLPPNEAYQGRKAYSVVKSFLTENVVAVPRPRSCGHAESPIRVLLQEMQDHGASAEAQAQAIADLSFLGGQLKRARWRFSADARAARKQLYRGDLTGPLEALQALASSLPAGETPTRDEVQWHLQRGLWLVRAGHHAAAMQPLTVVLRQCEQLPTITTKCRLTAASALLECAVQQRSAKSIASYGARWVQAVELHHGSMSLEHVQARRTFIQHLMDSGQSVLAYEELDSLLAAISDMPHPDPLLVFDIRSTLAQLRWERGDAQGALLAYQLLIDDQRAHEGPASEAAWRTMLKRCDLLGERDGALAVLTELEAETASAVSVLGLRHPLVDRMRRRVLHWRIEAHQVADALQLAEEMRLQLAIETGGECTESLQLRMQIAVLTSYTGAFADAREQLEGLLPEMVLRMGDEHPSTLLVRRYLAGARAEAGDVWGARFALEQLLNDQRRVLPKGHPDTMETLRALRQFSQYDV